MLSMSTYPQDYIDSCRRLVDSQLASYRALVAASGEPGGDRAGLDAAVADFEPRLLSSMVLVLDQLFVHRARGKEGNDGNPLNEVRVLCRSIMENDGVMAADKSITLSPATSVLKHAVGDRIGLTPSDFALISEAYFAEIERRFAEPS
jgi:hypothetical protein